MGSYATPIAQVSAYCCAVLSNIIPRGFFGEGEVQDENWRVLLRNVHRFVGLRRWESVSLHEVCQGIRVSFIINTFCF